MLDSPPVPYSFSSSISDHLSDWEDCLIADLLLGTVFSVNSHGFYCHLAHSEVSLSESNLKNFKVIVRQVQSPEIIFFFDAADYIKSLDSCWIFQGTPYLSYFDVNVFF